MFHRHTQWEAPVVRYIYFETHFTDIVQIHIIIS